VSCSTRRWRLTSIWQYRSVTYVISCWSDQKTQNQPSKCTIHWIPLSTWSCKGLRNISLLINSQCLLIGNFEGSGRLELVVATGEFVISALISKVITWSDTVDRDRQPTVAGEEVLIEHHKNISRASAVVYA
jgi:hypothetical protein